MGGQVNVAVDASPSTDLNQTMTEIREHYEGVIAKNRKELEAWYHNKVRPGPRSGRGPTLPPPRGYKTRFVVLCLSWQR